MQSGPCSEVSSALGGCTPAFPRAFAVAYGWGFGQSQSPTRWRRSLSYARCLSDRTYYINWPEMSRVNLSRIKWLNDSFLAILAKLTVGVLFLNSWISWACETLDLEHGAHVDSFRCHCPKSKNRVFCQNTGAVAPWCSGTASADSSWRMLGLPH